MKAFKYVLPIVAGLAFSSACRDRDSGYEARPKPVEDPVEVEVDKKPAQPADVDIDVNVRERDTSELRARLSRLDDRIAELRARGTEEASQAADALEVRRDEAAAKLDRAGEEAAATWDNFKAGVKQTFDELERDVDDALD
jgi:hypothetical protein